MENEPRNGGHSEAPGHIDLALTARAWFTLLRGRLRAHLVFRGLELQYAIRM